MLKTFRYRLYPSHSQERLLEQTLETCRRWYNTCLGERRTAWDERRENMGKFAQLRKVKDLRANNPYAAKVHSHVLQLVVQDLDLAFQAFFRRVKTGETPGFPRFKARNRFDSFGYKEYTNGFKLDGRRLRLSGIGRVRVRWHRPIEGKIKTLRLHRSAGQWYACFACETETAPLAPTGQDIGVDLGVHHLLATSAGEIIDNPQWYSGAQAKLRTLQRRVERRAKGGSNRRKAIIALQRQHQRIVNQRQDYLKKLAHSLIVRYDRIALEDLVIAKMIQDHRWSKNVLDASWGYLKLHLAHKAEEAGRVVHLVEPAYTSRTCSQCGAEFESLTPADRWVSCACGLSLDRDVNAARNILNRAGRARWGKTRADGPSVPQEASVPRHVGSVTVTHS